MRLLELGAHNLLAEEILEHTLMISQNEQFPLGLVNMKEKRQVPRDGLGLCNVGA